MPNAFFRFRQFTVWQERAAMKVCTDACLFGAWASAKSTDACRILDVGTGTGLLSLLLAQKTNALIDAIDIDGEAAAQAADNFERSPWKERLHATPASFQTYVLHSSPFYDLIICNPPFYESHLESSDHRRNVAMHGLSLSLKEIFDHTVPLLSDRARLALMLPADRAEEACRLAARMGLLLNVQLNVRQTPRHSFFRSMLLFCNHPVDSHVAEIAIKNASGEYTPEFLELMADYYLMPYNENA